MWQYLFLQKAIDCPIEHKAYCRLYNICFGGWEEFDEWLELNQEKPSKMSCVNSSNKKPKPQNTQDSGKSVNEAIRVRKEVPIIRGSVEANRVAEGDNLYGDEVEPGMRSCM